MTAIATTFEHLSQRKFILLLGAILLISRLPSLFIQVIDLDETVYAVGGWVWSNHGVPYLNFADHKPPLLWLYYRFIIGTFGLDLRIVHAFTILVVAATVWAIYSAVRPINREGARWAALLYVFLEGSYKWHDMLAANSEIIFNLPVALSLFVYSKSIDFTGRRADTRLFLVGLLTGVAFWVKPQAGMTLAVFGSHIAMAVTLLKKHSEMKLSAGFRRLFWLVCGFTFICMLMVFWAYIGHFLNEMLYWAFTYNTGYISTGPQGVRYLYKFLKIPLWMATGSLIAWIGYALLFNFSRRNKNVDPRVWIFLLFVILILVPVQMGRFYPHYFIQFYPGLFAAGGLGLAFWFSKQRKKNHISKRKESGVFVLLVLPLLIFYVVGITRLIEKTDEESGPYWKNIGSYIEQNTTSDTRIFIWGFASPIYYWSKRMPATRFILCNTSISGYLPGSVDLIRKGEVPPISELVQREDRAVLLKQLRKTLPGIIVDTSPAKIHLFEYYPLDTFSELKQWIENNYVLETTINGADIYRLR